MTDATQPTDPRPASPVGGEALLPCPFCGGADLKVWERPRHGMNVLCTSCEAAGPFSRVTGDTDEHLEKWNTRAALSAPSVTREAVAWQFTADGEPMRAVWPYPEPAKDPWLSGAGANGQRPLYAALSAPSVTREAVAWVSRTTLAKLTESDRGCETANLWKTQPTDTHIALYAAPVTAHEGFATEITWLREAARYFSGRPTGGEDSAHWANVSNSETAKRIADRLAALSPTALEQGSGAVLLADDAPVWADGIVTDGERVAFAQKAEADYGGTYWATDEGNGCIEWEPTHFIPRQAIGATS